MTTAALGRKVDLLRPLVRLDVLRKFLVVNLATMFGTLGLASFIIAGFLVHVVLGFAVTGVCFLLMQKAVDRASDS